MILVESKILSNTYRCANPNCNQEFKHYLVESHSGSKKDNSQSQSSSKEKY
jgi:hypothetical protein